MYKRDHIIKESSFGEKCSKCGNPATHKVEESIEDLYNHPFTTYLCCYCFAHLFGKMAMLSCGITEDTRPPKIQYKG